MQEKELAEKYLVFKCVAGSHSYGTAIPGVSDLDTRGVFIAPPSHILSCIQSVEQCNDDTNDTVIYELQKFMRLAAQSNPNIIEILYIDDSDVLFIDPIFKKVRDNRHLFLSKKAKFTFSGYAMSQMHRIKGHHKWINAPRPAEHPKLADYCRFVKNDGSIITDPAEIRKIGQESFIAETFGTTQFRVFRSPTFFKERLGFFADNELQLKPVNIHDDVLKERAEYVGFLIVNLDQFKHDHREWKQYWEWKKNRNPIRAKMEEQAGFDLKHAMHLVRLMSMCKEILTTGEVLVKRPDAEYLLRIRNGDFDFDWLIKWAENTDQQLNELYDKSTLQYTADYAAIDNLYREIVMEYWQKNGLLN